MREPTAIVPADGDVVEDAQGHRFEFHVRPCPICEVSSTKFVGYRGGNYHRYGLGVPSLIVRCRSCGLFYADPFPFPLEASDLYGDPDKYFEWQDQQGQEFKLMAYRRLAQDLKGRLGTSSPSMLDVGSGRGELLLAARLEGIEGAVGLEISDAMVTAGRDRFDVEIRRETIEEHAEHAGTTYDAIMLAAILEHAHDPDSMIQTAARLSHAGTIVFLDLPVEPSLVTVVGNALHRFGSRAVYNLSPTFPPYHVYGFNPTSLGRLLGKHGFVMESYKVYAEPGVPARGGIKDRALAFAGTQVNRIANLTGTASNMHVWARATGDRPVG